MSSSSKTHQAQAAAVPVPATMRAVYQTQAGAPEAALQVGSLPTPVPVGSQLLVRVLAASLNPVDYKVSTTRTLPDDAPYVVGWDASGEVVALGPEAKLHKVGDEVMFSGDVTLNGTHAQYCAVDERLVGRKPASLSHLEAAVVPLTSLTAWEGLLENMAIPRSDVPTGKSLLVVGGAGGVGSMVTQVAKKLLGLTVIATASRDNTVAWAQQMGADHVVNHRHNLKEQFDALGLPPVDYVFNTASAADNLEEIAAVVAPLAKWVEINEPSTPLNMTSLFYKRVQLSFEFMFARSMFGAEPLKQRAILNEVADLLDRGVLRTTLTTPMDLFTEAQDAHNKQKSGTMIGKIGLTVDHQEE